VESKRCRICGQVKPLGDFYRASGMRDGHRSECKPCFGAQAKSRYESDPTRSTRAVERATVWRRDNPERSAAYQAEYRQRPERKRAMRDLYYRRTYGVSADEVDAMLEAQGGGCAICGSTPERLASLHLDHDHEHGHLRGLLCVSSNQGLGQFRDDPELLGRAIEYLRRTRRPSLGGSVASLAAV
jgi:hypothetical protein